MQGGLGRTGRRVDILLNDFASIVIAARGTNAVRQHARAAMVAINQLGYADGVVCPTAIASAFAYFTFWQWRHNFTLLKN